MLAVIAAPVAARLDTGSCGTTAATPAEVMFLHRQAERARAARRRPLAAAAAISANRDIGNVAIEDSDGVVENSISSTSPRLTTPAAGGARYVMYSALS
jgi:hypothetical protein